VVHFTGDSTSCCDIALSDSSIVCFMLAKYWFPEIARSLRRSGPSGVLPDHVLSQFFREQVPVNSKEFRRLLLFPSACLRACSMRAVVLVR
jgi:hypothetical protein